MSLVTARLRGSRVPARVSADVEVARPAPVTYAALESAPMEETRECGIGWDCCLRSRCCSPAAARASRARRRPAERPALPPRCARAICPRARENQGNPRPSASVRCKNSKPAFPKHSSEKNRLKPSSRQVNHRRESTGRFKPAASAALIARSGGDRPRSQSSCSSAPGRRIEAARTVAPVLGWPRGRPVASYRRPRVHA